MDGNEAKLVRLCAWSGVVFMVIFGVGRGVLGRNIPPYAANMPAAQLASIYRDHASTLRIGFALGAFGATFLASWAIGLFRIMLPLERGGQLLSYLQLVGGCCPHWSRCLPAAAFQQCRLHRDRDEFPRAP
jgi:hypothetical protein